MLAACSAHLKVPEVNILIYFGEKYKYNTWHNAVSFSLLLFALCYGKTFSSVTSVVKSISYKNYTDMEGSLMNSFYGKPQGFLLSACSYTLLKYPLAYGRPPIVGIDGHNNGVGNITDGDRCGEVNPWDFSQWCDNITVLFKQTSKVGTLYIYQKMKPERDYKT